jgi:signal transduction histidine kinase
MVGIKFEYAISAAATILGLQMNREVRMKIQKALGLGLCGIFTLMTVGQLGTLWWFQQQLQQQLTTQSGELSKLVLARTAEKLQLVTHNISAEGQSFVFSTDEEVEATTTKPDPEHATNKRVKVIRLNTPPTDALPGVMQQELEQILVELKTDRPGSAQWVQQFKLERNDSSAQLLQKYLAYQVIALAVTIALALMLVLWLGYRLIAPLQLLVQGFRRLAAGESSVQLPQQSTLTEYQYVLEQFNHASRQLDELAQQREQMQQQQQLAELGEISRGLVHALRNPIHTMALALEQLPQQAPEQQALQKLIEQKMQHINRTLTALLTLSCEGVDRSQPVSLPLVLKDITLEFSNQPVKIELHLPEDLAIHGAETELRSICHAVISNAVEASPAGGLVQISLSKMQGGAVLNVHDQGSGLAPDIAAALFQPHISSKAEGAGMGLYLCQRLLQRYYQGSVELHQAENGGCIATLHICSAAGATR